MSYNTWHHSYHSLAGPEIPSSPPTSDSCAPPRTPSVPHVSCFVQKNRRGDVTTRLDRYLTRPLASAHASDVVDAVQYHEPPFDETSASIPGFNIEVDRPFFLESRATGVPDMSEDKDPVALVAPRSCPTLPSLLYRNPLQASSMSEGAIECPPSPIALRRFEDSPTLTFAVTPKLEEPEDSSLDSSSSSLALSPYAPMPLPPIFTHESGSKVLPIPIDTISSSAYWLSYEKTREEVIPQERDVPVDPSLISYADPIPQPRNPFARGSTVIEHIWPLTPFVPAAQEGSFKYSEVSEIKNIPLEVAESKAAELRAAGTNVSLSSSFLMQFLGQPAGQTKWHCYIRGCGKQLTRKGHMIDHIRMHLDERSFACGHCTQTFLRKADCKRHAATHDAIKAFTCGSCPKSYARKDLLTRHARICLSKSDDHDIPAGNRHQQKRRKGIQTSRVMNLQGTHEMPAFVSPDMLFFPQGCYKDDEESQIWGYDEDNKENINPMMLPSGPMFGQSEWDADVRGLAEGDLDNRRKKARIRL